MIYEKPIEILKLPNNVGTPLQGTLRPVFSAFCGEMTVFHSRFWEAVQAGSRIDVMVELPLHRKNVSAGMFARYEGHVFSIEQAQFQKDNNQLPVTVLSLKRSEDQYDVAAV
jgi:hypothetical protein